MRLLIPLLILLLAPPVAAQTTATEDRILDEVASRADAAIDLLETAVNLNSGTMNFDGVRAVGELYAREFDAIGLETEWVDGSGFDRAGHLIARHQGSGSGPHLLLIGHLDTVFEPDSPFQRFERDGDRADGPGVVDMKGGNTVIVHALGALRRAGVLDGITLTVVLTGDEERSGRPLDAARKDLIDAARDADIALAFENGDSNPRTAVVARRGSTGWKLTVKGTPAHSSQLFQPTVGAGAIYEASRILAGFYEALAGEQNLTFNPGFIVGGTEVSHDAFSADGTAFGKNNVVAEHAIVTGDLRAISLEQLERTRERMRFVARHNLPGTEATIEFDDGYPPLAPTEGNYRLLALFDEVSRDLGHGPVAPVNPRNAGAADVSFTAGLVEMAIDGLGPGGGDDHTVDEWIDLPTLEMQTRRAAILIWRLAGSDNS
ncbi:MAG: M20/M25/M40 family metallo-hydrolase [Rhodothermales bacterium]|nr:M20/M25/M40 family metallo-hydrolase [Rhodothermales bacterium]MBO6780766.1 M20/M25/M40 family metallo-hydrolase [Rhodothermales bacterium]